MYLDVVESPDCVISCCTVAHSGIITLYLIVTYSNQSQSIGQPSINQKQSSILHIVLEFVLPESWALCVLILFAEHDGSCVGHGGVLFYHGLKARIMKVYHVIPRCIHQYGCFIIVVHLLFTCSVFMGVWPSECQRCVLSVEVRVYVAWQGGSIIYKQ